MTQGKHTPGGMTNHWDGEGWASVGIGGYIRADMVGPVADRKANARRICAAWNACEGISTEALEAGVVKDMLGALQAVGQSLGQGDGNDRMTYFVRDTVFAEVQAAIARATGGAK